MKKRYLIMLIIAIFLIICLGASLVFAYFFTDIFRSNKQLFSKYISQNSEILEIFKDEEIKSYSDKQKNTPYTSEGTIKTNVTFPDSSEAQMANALQNCNITFSGKTDESNKYMYHNVKANYSNTESMQIDLYRNGDIYATKINEVLFKYIGIENNNLKEFATKMQLPEQIISAIPNKLDLNELEKSTNVFSDADKSSLKEKYLKIITDNLTDDMFSKEKTSDETIYILTINEEQLKNILIKLLENLKEDETIINKLKETLINNYNFTEENIQIYVTQYKEYLQKIIDSINSSSNTNILERANKAKTLTDQKQIEERIQLTYLRLLSKNNKNVEKADLQTALEEEFGLGKVTDLADDFSTVKIDGKEYSITGNSTINQNSENENNTDISDENQNTENNTDSSKNIIIKVYTNRRELSKTEIITSDVGNFILSKSDDGAKFEIVKDNSTMISAYTQKLKSPNETKFEFVFSTENEEIFNLTTSFSGLDTNSVNENSELTFEYDLGNSTITDAKTKFVSSYKNTKTFGDIQKDIIPSSDILLLNTAPSIESIKNLYNNVETKLNQVNNAKLQALGLSEEQNPFIYYIPSFVPVGATYMLQNPDKSPYFVVPTIIGGLSTSMLIAENHIISKASDAMKDSSLSKEEIEVFNAKYETYSGKNKSISEIQELYASIIASNETETKIPSSNHIIKINNKLTKSIPNNLKANKKYSVSLEYDENGYVNNVKIKEK